MFIKLSLFILVKLLYEIGLNEDESNVKFAFVFVEIRG
jgi:hypothetical protein